MTIRNLFAFASVLSVSALPTLSHAHFLWITLSPLTKSATVGFQEIPVDAPLPLGERSAQVQAWSKEKKRLDLAADGNYFKTSTNSACVGADLDYGVIDRRDSGRGVFWLKYYAKAASTVKASEEKLGLPVEVTLTERDGARTVTVYQNGKPAANADLVVEVSDGKNAFEGKTDANGAASVPKLAGNFAIRALVTETGKGEHAGKSYDLVRSYSTLTVQEPEDQKPLTKQLRDSFGNNHEVVSHSLFVQTLMADSLTKAQYEDHLKQRALVHEAVDRILSSEKNPKPLPYGDSQKEVVTLLRQDLVAMGTDWPKSSEAWPVTKKFLDEINSSAKRGPYFALGVLHVYYGGITHGGRDIGAIIAKDLKVDPTYYLKSDGYDEYARGVDQITDPKAQREMIRGGDEAYKYILAVNNQDAFAPQK